MLTVTLSFLFAITSRANAPVLGVCAEALAAIMPAVCTGASVAAQHFRRAHFVAQACFETEDFRRMDENLSYSADAIKAVFPHLAERAAELAFHPMALGNAAYGGRYGNGDEASGDGFRYRGRGFFDHTFKENYQMLGDATGLPLVAQPDQLLNPRIAAEAAMHFWESHACNAAAEANDVERVTRIINGGTNGLEERAALTKMALAFVD